jgi:hypothetical protein
MSSVYIVYELAFNFSMLSTTSTSNERENLLARGRILNLLNNSLQETLLKTQQELYDSSSGSTSQVSLHQDNKINLPVL